MTLHFQDVGEPVLPAIPEPTLTVPPVAVVIEPELVGPASEQALEQRASGLIAAATALSIVDPASFDLAGRMLETLKEQERRIVEFFEADIQRAHATWKGLTTKRAGYVDPIKAAIVALSSRYGTFAREAREAAERERRRQEREAQAAEQQRLNELADRVAAEAREKEQQAQTAPSLGEAQLLEADASALTAEAETLREDARTVPAPVIPAKPIVETPKGVTVRASWKHEVEDLRALVKAVAAGDVPIQAIQANDVYLGQRARADRGTAKIAGVRFFDATSVAHRRSK